MLLVVWGQLFLPTSLSPTLLLLFWTACLWLTLVTIFIALTDFVGLVQRTRQERRHLREQVLLCLSQQTAPHSKPLKSPRQI